MILDNLRAMAVFVAVVRHGSFSGAAKELGITTSAVSQQFAHWKMNSERYYYNAQHVKSV